MANLTEAQELVQQLALVLNTNAVYEVSPTERLQIYGLDETFTDLTNFITQPRKTYSKITFPATQKRYALLSIITAEHLLTLWHQNSTLSKDLVKLPYEILDVAHGTWRGTIKLEDGVEEFCENFYHTIGAVAYDLDYKSWLVVEAAYHALGATVGVRAFQDQKVDIQTTNARLVITRSDVALAAATAWCLVGERHRAISVLAKDIEPELIFDRTKCAEFWSWWLSNAVPKMWDTHLIDVDAGNGP